MMPLFECLKLWCQDNPSSTRNPEPYTILIAVFGFAGDVRHVAFIYSRNQIREYLYHYGHLLRPEAAFALRRYDQRQLFRTKPRDRLRVYEDQAAEAIARLVELSEQMQAVDRRIIMVLPDDAVVH